jgi:hypothetical protein
MEALVIFHYYTLDGRRRLGAEAENFNVKSANELKAILNEFIKTEKKKRMVIPYPVMNLEKED